MMVKYRCDLKRMQKRIQKRVQTETEKASKGCRKRWHPNGGKKKASGKGRRGGSQRGTCMFTERLDSSFKLNEPIFTNELEKLFPEYSHSRLFRRIDEAVECGSLARFDRSVYYIPAPAGSNVPAITTEDVVRKKYLGWGDERYGTYAGIKIMHDFCITRREDTPVEIVTNMETSRGRLVEINGTKYLIKKSRCEITADNVSAYTLVQLFDEMSEGDRPSRYAMSRITKFIQEKHISMDQVMDISKHFSTRPLKRLTSTGVIAEIA